MTIDVISLAAAQKAQAAVARRDQQEAIRRRLYDQVYSDIRVKPGRAVVCLSSDDSPSQDYTSLWPTIRDNLLPWSLAVCGTGTDVHDLGQSGRLTWAQLQEMRDQGCEVVCHSRTHNDPTTDGGLGNFIDETVEAADDLAAGVGGNGSTYNIDTFVQPGTWTGDYLFDSPAKIDPPSVLGDYFRSRFALVMAYVTDDQSGYINGPPPTWRKFGVARPMLWEQHSLALIQTQVGYARQYGGLVSLSGHAFRIGTVGYNDLTTVQSILTWLAGQRDAGNIEILTLTAAFHARKDAAGRINLLSDGAFAQDTAGTIGSGGALLGWQYTGTPTVVSAGGPAGENTLYTNVSSDSIFIDLPVKRLRNLLIEFDAKRHTAGTAAQARLQITTRQADGTLIGTPLDIRTGTSGPGPWAALTASWQHYRALHAVDPTASFIRVKWLGPTDKPELTNLAIYKT